jgi:hypothetical protein
MFIVSSKKKVPNNRYINDDVFQDSYGLLWFILINYSFTI